MGLLTPSDNSNSGIRTWAGYRLQAMVLLKFTIGNASGSAEAWCEYRLISVKACVKRRVQTQHVIFPFLSLQKQQV